MNGVLSVFAALLFMYFYVKDVRLAFSRKGDVFKEPVLRATFVIIVFVLGTFFFTFKFFNANGHPELIPYEYAISILLSASISWVWMRYIRAIDIFEPERNKYLFLTFVLSCITIWLVYPLSAMLNGFGFTLGKTSMMDLLYCIFAIGSVEEFVKILPVFFILYRTSQINEPIDYIVYGSASALGFAFIENTMYINNSNLTFVAARLLYSSVGHMFFTSIICYGLARDKVLKKPFRPERFFWYFLLASLGHGLYDFWLLSPDYHYPILTTAIVLLSLHLWVIMKNNLLNHSTFYSDTVKIKRQSIKYALLVQLTAVIYSTYYFIALLYGQERAMEVLSSNFVNYLFMLVYLVLSFSSFKLIRSYWAPLKIPRLFFLPKIENYTSFEKISVKLVLRDGRNRQEQEIRGSFVKQMVVKDDMNWYLFESYMGRQQFLVKMLTLDPFEKGELKKIKLCTTKKFVTLNDSVLQPSDLTSCKLAFAYSL